MKLYGMTGGPGMGKSQAAEYLLEARIPVIDTDDLARAVVQPDQPGLAAVVQEFGSSAIDAGGQLRRGFLAELVFKDPPARLKLEAILHPLIRQRWLQQVEKWKSDGRAEAVVVIPLLFETQAEHYFERVICIASSFERQSARLQSRGWSSDQVSGRLSAQWPIEQKMERSDYVIWNDSSLSNLRKQLGRTPPMKGRP